MNTKKLALLSLTVAFSLILSFIESQIPPFFPVPGIKLGLANAVVVFLLYTADFKFALAVSLIRIFLASMLFGSVMTLAYSFFGGISSFMVMFLMKKTGFFSCIGVSVCGGVVHNLAQITVAAVVMETAGILTYFPALLVSGTVCGAAVGVLAGLVTQRFKNIFNA